MKGFESGGFHREVVGAGRECGYAIQAFLVGDDFAGNTCCLALYGDVRIGHGEPEGSEMIPERSAVCAIRRMGTRAKKQSSNSDRPHCGYSFSTVAGPGCWSSTNLARRCGGTPAAFNPIGGTNGCLLSYMNLQLA